MRYVVALALLASCGAPLVPEVPAAKASAPVEVCTCGGRSYQAVAFVCSLGPVEVLDGYLLVLESAAASVDVGYFTGTLECRQDLDGPWDLACRQR